MFPNMWDLWVTSQAVDVVLIVSAFSGDVDKPEMPPEKSNWNKTGKWVKGRAVEGSRVLAWRR